MKALTLLIKPASGHCNLRCKYCFYADVTDSRTEKNYGMMRLDTLEKLMKSLFEEVTEFCLIGFQGGEPTLAGLDFFKSVVVLEKKYNVNRVKVDYTIQTNGLFINDEWASFFAENKFLVGLSVDAGVQIHDGFRVDANGNGTHQACLQAACLLEKYRVDFNILSVVTNKMASQPDKVWQFYREQNFKFLQFIPCLDPFDEEEVKSYSLDAQTYGKFLCQIFDLWYEALRRDKYISIRTFDNYIHMLNGHQAEVCALRGVCTAYGLVESNGNVYPCDFYAIDEYLLGNIHTHSFEEMILGNVATAFTELSKEVDVACKGCKYFFICRGGCRRDREPRVDGSLSLNRFCEAYKVFFSYALPRMEHIAKMERMIREENAEM